MTTYFTQEHEDALAIHLLNKWRAMTDLGPAANGLNDLSEFAREDWRKQARVMLNAAGMRPESTRPEPIRDNRCYCMVPHPVGDDCMKCGGVLSENIWDLT